MTLRDQEKTNTASPPDFFSLGVQALSYWTDACQRGILFLDVLRRRGEQYREHIAKAAPHVLQFEFSVEMDGRQLPRPTNYILVRIKPPRAVSIDPKKRPFIVVDPRAGHGPGIGGFKPDSEIGVALKAGHPCYFIGFLPEPMPGQTIEDVARTEAAFIEHVIKRHPEAEGKPAIIGNCQAGWAVMMLAAMRPELFGPIIVAGSPLSYWAGVHGENPMRYTGGLLGGSWLTALTGDLGHGKFDGAWLVTNFENLNPANTYWSKLYNLYSKIDTEGPRFLDFEQWWGGHVLLNAEEMQFIADELFIGDKLAAGEVRTSDGYRVDLRNIKSPIIVFCSKGDNITPPPQALDWILDLYESVDDIRTHGQTIIYSVHESIGHLGIFVSKSVAKKEHDEFASNIDLIDVLPPGLYEAVITRRDDAQSGADLIEGEHHVRFEMRTLDDIRALGVNTPEDDRKFETVSRISKINLDLYRLFWQPWVKNWMSDDVAEWNRRLHPSRVQFEMFAPNNPFVKPLPTLTDLTIQNRQPVAPDNVFWQMQEAFSHWLEISLNAYGKVRDAASESLFHTVYGSPLLQASVGLGPSHDDWRTAKDPVHLSAVAERIKAMSDQIEKGGAREAIIRSLIYVRMPDGVVDERGFNFLQRLRDETGHELSLSDFKRILREQYFMLLIDEPRAVAAIKAMLASEPQLATRLMGVFSRLVDSVGIPSKIAAMRLSEIESIFKSIAEPEQTPVIQDRSAEGAAAHSHRQASVSKIRVGG